MVLGDPATCRIVTYVHVHTQILFLTPFGYTSTCTVIPYGRKFSRDPIFAEGPSSKISRSNFRGWTFQGCSTSYCTRAAAQEPAEKKQQAIDRSYTYT